MSKNLLKNQTTSPVSDFREKLAKFSVDYDPYARYSTDCSEKGKPTPPPHRGDSEEWIDYEPASKRVKKAEPETVKP